MNVPTPPIIYVINAVNDLPEEAVLEHASELCRMLSNLLDDHTELIDSLNALLAKLATHYDEINELIDSFASEKGLTTAEQFQIFEREVEEQKQQHQSLQKLMDSISAHLTAEELSSIKDNTVSRREIHETVHAIMDKYEELMEEKE